MMEVQPSQLPLTTTHDHSIFGFHGDPRCTFLFSFKEKWGALRFGEKGLPLSSLRKKYAQVGNSEMSSPKSRGADNSFELF